MSAINIPYSIKKTKNTMNTPDKISFLKYSPKLRKRVLFTETKKSLGRNEVKPKK